MFFFLQKPICYIKIFFDTLFLILISYCQNIFDHVSQSSGNVPNVRQYNNLHQIQFKQIWRKKISILETEIARKKFRSLNRFHEQIAGHFFNLGLCPKNITYILNFCFLPSEVTAPFAKKNLRNQDFSLPNKVIFLFPFQNS